ncbi:hypothetical protein ANTPLA_LOCUS2947 [Anthophora plagiata]
MERALMIWLEDCIAKKIPISGNLIKQKALKIYEHLRNIGHSYAGLENHSFVASKGWFEKLKKSDEEFAVNHQDVRELVLGEETLDEEELMELIDASTSNALLAKELAEKEKKEYKNIDYNQPSPSIVLRKNARHAKLDFVKETGVITCKKCEKIVCGKCTNKIEYLCKRCAE